MPFAARKNKKQKGFTLPEVLVVVALVAVLLAFGVIAILGLVNRLKLRALDTDAQTIFMAAQDRLTAMANAGELDDLAAILTTGDKVKVPAGKAEDAVDVSAGYLELAYLDSDETDVKKAAALAGILPFGSIESELRAGHYVVEFSTRTGTVYGVWYTDEEGFQYKDDIAELDATERAEAEKFETRLGNRPLVGFYGGSAVDRPTVDALPIPQVSLLNAEVLRLRVTIPKVTDPTDPTNGQFIDVKVRVRRLGDTDDSHWVELDLGDSANPGSLAPALKPVNSNDTKLQRIAGADAVGDILLDAAYPLEAIGTLYGGSIGSNSKDPIVGTTGTHAKLLGCRQFRQWVGYNTLKTVDTYNAADETKYDSEYYAYDGPGEPPVRPGDTITVEVSLSYRDADKDYPSETVYVTANSLFSDLTPNTSGTGYTADLTYCRHLQNLCAHVNGCYGNGEVGVHGTYKPFLSGLDLPDASSNSTKLTRAALIRELDFINEDVSDKARSWVGSYGFDTAFNGMKTYDAANSAEQYSARLPHRFESIYCNTARDLQIFDGGGRFIKNLNTNNEFVPKTAEGKQPHTGLFGMIVDNAMLNTPRTVEDLTLINCRALNGKKVGTLAAAACSTNFTNCRVYLEGEIPKDGDTPRPFVSTIQSTDNAPSAGGLVGTVKNCTLTSCSAATVIKGLTDTADSGTGGLIGSVSNNPGATSVLLNCHAASYILDGGNIGGLYGSAGSNCKIQNCYAAGFVADVADGGEVAGITNTASSIEGTNNVWYSAVRYSDVVAKKSRDNKVTVYGVKPTVDEGKTYYVQQQGVTYQTRSGTAKSTAELAAMIGKGRFTAANGWYVPEGSAMTNPTYAVLPYNLRPAGETWPDLTTPYPYPQLAMGLTGGTLTTPGPTADRVPMVHYGDWLESDEAASTMLAYYDTVDGETGYYGLPADTNVPINTLSFARDSAATTDGYAVLSHDELTGDALKYTLNEESTQRTLAPASAKVKVGSDEYYRYDLSKDAWEAAVTAAEAAAKKQDGNYYQKITMTSGRVMLFNPLFACEAFTYASGATYDATDALAKPGLSSKKITSSTASDDVQVGDGIVLRTPRHLANAAALSADKASTNDPDAATVQTDQINPWRTMTYHQLLDMDYTVYSCVNGIADLKFTTGKENSDKQTPLLLGDNPKGTGKNAQPGAYYGNEYIIRGPMIGSVTDARETANSDGKNNGRNVAGLFGLVTNGSKVDGVRLVNANVSAPNATDSKNSYVGAIAGKVAGTTTEFTDCGVYVDAGTKYSNYVVKDKKEGSSIGGFAGEFEGKATACFAAVQVKAEGKNSNAGGFVGVFKDATVKNCYAGGHTEKGVYKSDDDSVNVWVSGETSNAGGFAGKVTNGDSKNKKMKTLTLQGVCYTTCSVRNDKRDKETSDPKEYNGIGLFVGLRLENYAEIEKEIDPALKGTAAEADAEAFVYSTGVAFKNNDIIDPYTESKYLDQLIPEVGTRTGYSLTTNPYDSAMVSTAEYPYITNLEAHYGDWPTKLNLVYYEVYDRDPKTGAVKVSDRTSGNKWYGFYGQWRDETGTSNISVNTLATGGYAVDAGYALITDEKRTSFVWGSESYSSDTGRTMKYGTATAGTPDCVELVKENYKDQTAAYDLFPADYVYTLPFEAVSQAPLDTYYRVISIDGATTVCNPHFACEALNISNSFPKTMQLGDGRSYEYSDFQMDDIQPKPGLQDAPTGDPNQSENAPANFYKAYKNCVIIRTPQQLASVARYTRENNNLISRANSRGWAYHQLLDLDYDKYTGKIYDGNSGVRKNNRDDNIAGKKASYPQLAVMLGQKGGL